MKRRDAIKSITLSSGMFLSSGTLLSILQACNTREKNSWKPEFFSEQEAIIFNKLCDFFIPGTATPGAIDVGVPQIVDLLLKDVYPEKETIQFKGWIRILENTFSGKYKNEFGNDTKVHQLEFFNNLYQLKEKEWDEVNALLQTDPAPETDSRYLLYHALHNLRQAIIDAYCTSREIGEEVLSYDPNPGVYLGCIPVQEVKNVWSY